MGWVIYISGFILTYLFCKWLRNRGNDNTWGDVGATLFLSMLSWVAIICLVCLLLVLFFVELVKVKNPPKWL